MASTDEQRMLFKPYVFLTTIQRYFGLDKQAAIDTFIKVQQADERKGYIKIYDDRVRSEGVFEELGLSLETALKRYEIKQKLKEL